MTEPPVTPPAMNKFDVFAWSPSELRSLLKLASWVATVIVVLYGLWKSL